MGKGRKGRHRDSLVQREANGRPQRLRLHREVALPPPTETKRLMDAAVAGMRPAEWGSMLGRLYLAGRISETQYAAGRRWCRMIEEYSGACLSPQLPRSATLDPAGGTPPDPDTASGVREAKRHAAMVKSYESGIEALRHAGMASVRVVGAVCEQDLAPVGVSEIEALRTGLSTLATLWSTQGQRAKAIVKPSPFKNPARVAKPPP
jgi:hypothetical protein